MEVDEAMPTRTEKRKVRFVVVSLENAIFDINSRARVWVRMSFYFAKLSWSKTISFLVSTVISDFCKGLTSYRTPI